MWHDVRSIHTLGRESRFMFVLSWCLIIAPHLFMPLHHPTVAHLCADDISGVLATVQMYCPDKSPQQMWNCVRELCEMVADSMVAQVDVKLTEGWFLCWEAMLRLRGTGYKSGLCILLSVCL